MTDRIYLIGQALNGVLSRVAVETLIHNPSDYTSPNFVEKISEMAVKLADATLKSAKIPSPPPLVEASEAFNKAAWKLIEHYEGSNFRINDADTSPWAKTAREFLQTSDTLRGLVAEATLKQLM